MLKLHRLAFRIVMFLLVISVGAIALTADAQQKGRYKKQGDRCEWDANDSGPNQCTPVTQGRFKKEGDTCKWVSTEAGADQCRPKTGRFKKEGAACVWNGTDSGPDQCNPRQAR